jgi:hypothetical protein
VIVVVLIIVIVLLFLFVFALLLFVLPLNPGLFLIIPPFFSQEMLCKKGKAIANEKNKKIKIK